ncbi:MAG: hypothetical protein J3K34DRAFT_412334 [Monoraphidium minutum]|nr:MAG: hypothetical protein J3K34DRAFT_412334 [Monoraphidium minutum]
MVAAPQKGGYPGYINLRWPLLPAPPAPNNKCEGRCSAARRNALGAARPVELVGPPVGQGWARALATRERRKQLSCKCKGVRWLPPPLGRAPKRAPGRSSPLRRCWARLAADPRGCAGCMQTPPRVAGVGGIVSGGVTEEKAAAPKRARPLTPTRSRGRRACLRGGGAQRAACRGSHPPPAAREAAGSSVVGVCRFCSNVYVNGLLESNHIFKASWRAGASMEGGTPRGAAAQAAPGAGPRRPTAGHRRARNREQGAACSRAPAAQQPSGSARAARREG